jgi:hypothetical protein
MRRFAAILALVLGLTLLAAPPASVAVAAHAENRASGSAAGLTTLIEIEARLSEEAVRENVSSGYDLASDDAVAARGATVAEDAIRLHHAWPKYLGGAAKQDLAPLSKSLHDAFHSGLDKILPRQWGSAYYESLGPAARQQILQDLGAYTKGFDAKYGTQLYDALIRNGFPGP